MSRCFCHYKSVKRILQIRPWLAGTEMQLNQLKRDEFLRSAVRRNLAARHTRAAAGNAGCRVPEEHFAQTLLAARFIGKIAPPVLSNRTSGRLSGMRRYF
jgi:hypothetical protein